MWTPLGTEHHCSNMLSMLICASVLLGVVISQASALSCSGIKPVDTLNLDEISGKWAVIESLRLKPAERPPCEAPKPPPRCVSTKIKTDEGHVFLKFKMYQSEEETVTRRATFGVSSSEPGRWTKQSNVTNSQKHEILVLSANSDKSLVILDCVPGQNTTTFEPSQVCFMSRIVHDEEHSAEQGSHVTPVTEEELMIFRANVVKLLGLKEINTIKLKTDCFNK